MCSVRKLSTHLLLAAVALALLCRGAAAQAPAKLPGVPAAPSPVPMAGAPASYFEVGTPKRVRKEKTLPIEIVDYDKEFISAYAGGSAYALGERNSLQLAEGESVRDERAYVSEYLSASAEVFGIDANLFSLSGQASTYSWGDATSIAPVSYARIVISIRGETVFSEKQPNFVAWNEHDKVTLYQAQKWILIGIVPVRISISTGAELGGEMVAGAWPKAGSDDIANLTSMAGAAAFGSVGVYVDVGLFAAGVEGILKLFDTDLTVEWSARPTALDLDVRLHFQALSIKVRIVLYTRKVTGTWYKPWTWDVELVEVDHKTLFKYECGESSRTLIDQTY